MGVKIMINEEKLKAFLKRWCRTPTDTEDVLYELYEEVNEIFENENLKT